jgi:hypothetical protein
MTWKKSFQKLTLINCIQGYGLAGGNGGRNGRPPLRQRNLTGGEYQYVFELIGRRSRDQKSVSDAIWIARQFGWSNHEELPCG